MKYLIVSDIHGSLPRLKMVLEHFESMKIDMLIVLGDILNYGPRNGVPEGLDAPGIVELLNKYADRIVAVRGNCDAEVDQMLLGFPMMADYALLVDGDRRFFFTHGHIYNEKNLPTVGVDVFCYGHTHLQTLKKENGKVILNTGSITFPKGGNEPTFATYIDGELAIRRLNGEVISCLAL